MTSHTLSINNIIEGLKEDPSFQGLRKRFPQFFVMRDGKSQIIHIRLNEFISELDLVPADISLKDESLYSLVALIENGEPIIKCGWKRQQPRDMCTQEEYTEKVRKSSRVAMCGVPLSKQCALLWDSLCSTWRVVSPSRTHYTFNQFINVYKRLLPDAVYHFIETDTFKTPHVQQQNGFIIKHYGRRDSQSLSDIAINVQQIHDFKTGQLIWSYQNNATDTTTTEPYTDIFDTRNPSLTPLPLLHFDISGPSQVLWSWGSLHTIVNTAQFGSAVVWFYNENGEIGEVAIYKCGIYKFTHDLLQHPQPISHLTRRLVICNRVSRRADNTGLQLLTSINQDDFCADQAVAFPEPLQLDVLLNWQSYYALTMFGYWESLSQKDRLSHCPEFAKKVSDLIQLDIFKCGQSEREHESGSRYSKLLFSKFKNSSSMELFQAFQHSGTWYSAAFKGLSFYSYIIQCSADGDSLINRSLTEQK